jgi:hypothetical protein
MNRVRSDASRRCPTYDWFNAQCVRMSPPRTLLSWGSLHYFESQFRSWVSKARFCVNEIAVSFRFHNRPTFRQMIETATAVGPTEPSARFVG